ncbi:uncharacterized protein [Misgurnus anguillicaudatus]|uniref:uncharacterized protein n=1 Tax=Misgurnus anguillicaudatus TaxID=75329 RepID=UPI003CCF86CE
MFTILLIVSMFSQGLTIVSYGKMFITAFPENIAYFYPNTSRTLRVTALHDDTSVDIFYNSSSTPTQTISIMQKGQTAVVVFPKSAEVYQLNYSTKSIRINSSKIIAVHSLSNTNFLNQENYQSNVVQPNENLDRYYLIPSLNYTNLLKAFGITQSAFWSGQNSSFRLIIINAENRENNITIVKNIPATIQLVVNFTIPPYQLIQLQANASLMMVNSSRKIAVLLTHPCLDKPDCTCSMIVNQILPVRLQGQNFVVPYIPDITQTWLLNTSIDKTNLLKKNNFPLTPSSSGFLSISNLITQYVTASSNMFLRQISTGLFMELIPENMFAACYLLQLYTGNSRAFVIANRNNKDDTRLDTNQITGTSWIDIPDSDYASALVTLTDTPHVIWHPSSKIAVYILEKTSNIVYGGSAIPINEKPDPNGCIAPGEFVFGDQPLKWTESLDYCTTSQSEFACPINEDLQIEFARQVNTTNVDGWIGLRRSLMTTAWYWQNKTSSLSSTSTSPPVDYVYWAKGKPTTNGFCASLSLNGTDDFKWKSARCCEKKLPVCYKQPNIFNPIVPVLSAINIS